MNKFLTIVLSTALLVASLHGATVNLVQDSVDDASAVVIGAVSSDQYWETGSSYPTVTAPALSNGFRFTRWTNSSYPATSYRDAWGRSQNPISFVLLEDTTCTAHYLPEAQDSDGDGLPDWYEIEYFGDLSPATTDDGDSDGIILSAEIAGGTHPLYGDFSVAGGVAYQDSGLVTVNLAGYSQYSLRSDPPGTVDESAYVDPGTEITTPDLSGNIEFGYWTLDGVRQEDAWGRAYTQLTFTVEAADREAVAHLFPGDSDLDGVADAYELAYFGTLDHDGTHDADGDGITLLAEIGGGTNPLQGNSSQEGGVAWADSETVTVNLADFSRYTLSSLPGGLVDETAVVTDGSVVTTLEIADPTFGYWVLDGVRQEDAWGVALRQLVFMVDGSDRTAVAHFFADDSDEDGINDGYEQMHFGSLVNDASSDMDGDGITLLAEFNGGTNPNQGNSYQKGGVAWSDSAMVVVNLQPYERLDKVQVGGTLVDFFSSDPANPSGIQTGTWSAPAVSDWDGDGDMDLFIADEGGLLVFRNVGSAGNPNLEAVTGSFDGLSAWLAALNRPILAGGDWNGDGKGDLVVGGDTGTLRFISSDGSFSIDGSGVDFPTGSPRARPALGDMDGDGKVDLLVLLDDGSVDFYSNNGQPFPFAGPPVSNYLGSPAPLGTSITIGDLNQDGFNDVLLSDSEGRIWEFHQNAGGGFALLSKVWAGSSAGFASGLALAATDLENDGDLDLISGNALGGVLGLRDPNVGRPTGLIAAAGGDSIQLTWDANRQSRIRGYYVYRAGAAEGPWSNLLTDYLTLPSYLDRGLTPATAYYYYVTGVSYFYLPGNSEPRFVESLPSELATEAAGHVKLSLRSIRGKPSNAVDVPISIENATGLSGQGLSIRVGYDPAMLTPITQVDNTKTTVTLTGLSSQLSITDNGATANGELVITGSSGDIVPGAGKLFTLSFKVVDNAQLGAKTTIGISAASMNSTAGTPVIVDFSGSQFVEIADDYLLGDVDGDGVVTAADEDLLKLLTMKNSRTPTDAELKAGDLNGDGKLDQKDRVLLKRLLAGLPLN